MKIKLSLYIMEILDLNEIVTLLITSFDKDF